MFPSYVSKLNFTALDFFSEFLIKLSIGIEKLRERIKDRSLLTCLLRQFCANPNSNQAQKPRSQSAFRNVRSKVDTSQPKSFTHRSSSLQRQKKEAKKVIVPISLSPPDGKKEKSPEGAKKSEKERKKTPRASSRAKKDDLRLVFDFLTQVERLPDRSEGMVSRTRPKIRTGSEKLVGPDFFLFKNAFQVWPGRDFFSF